MKNLLQTFRSDLMSFLRDCMMFKSADPRERLLGVLAWVSVSILVIASAFFIALVW